MSADHELGPLPGALAALVAAERRAPAAPAADRARVWSAIAAKLPMPPADGGGGGGGAAAGGGGGAALPWIAGVSGAGAVIAIVAATRAPEPPPVKAPIAPVAVVAPAPDAALAVVPMPDPVPAPVAALEPAPAKRAVRKPAEEPAPEPEPAAEPVDDDVLLERARISLVRAHFDEALKLLTEHEKRFPRGASRGERELLTVRALLGTSNRAAAEERADLLRSADPQNPKLPAIEAALAR